MSQLPFTFIELLQVYLIALSLIPLCVCGYGLSFVIDAKEIDDMVRECRMMMRFCVRMIAPYFAITTLIFAITSVGLLR